MGRGTDRKSAYYTPWSPYLVADSANASAISQLALTRVTDVSIFLSLVPLTRREHSDKSWKPNLFNWWRSLRERCWGQTILVCRKKSLIGGLFRWLGWTHAFSPFLTNRRFHRFFLLLTPQQKYVLILPYKIESMVNNHVVKRHNQLLEHHPRNHEIKQNILSYEESIFWKSCFGTS